MLKTTGSNGFQITFANGYTVSVQWGEGNYCDNRDNRAANKFADNIPGVPCKNAEIAAWDSAGKWVDMENGDVVDGWKTPEEVAAFIQKISSI